MKLTKHIETKINEFKSALSGAAEGVLLAGKILCDIVDAEPDAYEIMLTECKGVTLPFLEALERVGRGKLLPELLLNPAPACQRAIGESLNIKEQNRLLTGTIPTVIRENGGVRTVNKRLEELSAHEAVRVVGDGKIRTPEEQIEVLKTQEAQKAARELRYEIRGSRVIFHSTHAWEWSELIDISEKIKPKAADLEKAIRANQLKG